MVTAGVAHFAVPKFFIDIMPEYLPYHKAMVYISGVFEILGGVGLLVPFAQKLSGVAIFSKQRCVDVSGS